MDMKKLLVLVILSIFVIGMVVGVASASHTFKKKGYKMKVSDKQYKKLKKTDGYMVSKKVGTKKVTKYKTVKVKTAETFIDSNGNVYKSKYWNPYKKVGNKAKYVKETWKYYSDGDICYEYFKVPKTVKKTIYMAACHDSRYGDHKIHVELYDFNPKG